jgi:hypothetical protein
MGKGHWYMRDMCLGVYEVKRIGMDGTFPLLCGTHEQAGFENDIARQLHVVDEG